MAADQIIERARRVLRRSRAKAELTDLRVEEVSLVDHPAVPLATIAVRKRDVLHASIVKAQAARATLGEKLCAPGLQAARILKSSAVEELRYIAAIVAVPDEVDRQGDTMTAETIRKAAWGYLADHRQIGMQHEAMLDATKARVVESWIAPTAIKLADVDVPEGSWVIGIHIPDDALWARVKSGAIGGVSLGGTAKKVQIGKAASPIDSATAALSDLDGLRRTMPEAKPADARDALAAWLTSIIRALGTEVQTIDTTTRSEPNQDAMRAWIEEAQRTLAGFTSTAAGRHMNANLTALLAAGICNRLHAILDQVTR